MKRTVFQHPELRDANDNIIQQGAFGKNTALANATNDGWIDYVANDLEALHDNINGSRIYVASKAKLPATGDLSAMYIAEDTGKWYLWDGQKYIETDNARKIADEAIAARDAAKASANDAANSAREQQANWAVTDTTSKAFIKNKPGNLINIGNSQKFDLVGFSKGDNSGNPVYFLMHELVQYNPDKQTLPISAVYGFNGMVFGQPRLGNGSSQFLAIVKVGLGFEYNDLYSSSGHYSPVVIKDETNNKYYWAMKINGSYQWVYMLGTFTANPLNTVISAVDIAGTLPEGWSLVHTAKPYPFDNTHVASADKDGQGNTIAGTYLPLAGGTMTGLIQYVDNGKVFTIGNTGAGNVDLCWNWANREGAGIGLRSADYLNNPGGFSLFARVSANSCSLDGKPDGTLTWAGKEVERVNASGSNYIRFESGLQIVWDKINVAASSIFTYTYPVAFKENPVIATGLRWAIENEQVSVQDDSKTSAKFKLTNSGTNSHNIFLIAVGKWK